MLKSELSKKKNYDNQKEARIKKLKGRLAAISNTDYKAQYDVCSRLYEEYKSYQFDSAYVYTQKLLVISLATTDISKLYDSRIKLSFILLSSGMFKETFESLSEINSNLLNNESKLEYYSIKSRAYSDLGDYNSDKNYAPFDQTEAVKYIDSAIALSKPGSFEQLYHLGNRQVVAGDVQNPSLYYIKLLDHYDLTAHQRAMVATGLSFFYNGLYDSQTRTNLLTIGAINDIRSSTKRDSSPF